MRSSACAIAVVLGALPVVASADSDDEAPAVARGDASNSINVSPLGITGGDYSIAYERLFGGRHGLVVEGTLSRVARTGGASLHAGGGAGYRWHWRGRQRSGFLGIMLANRFGLADVIDGDRMSHAMALRGTTLTGNVGKRWLIGRHVNITFRAGAGWGRYGVTARETTPEAKAAEQLVSAYLRFLPLAFDGELSAGVVF